jgi:outer membrane protein assembly factor BamB
MHTHREDSLAMKTLALAASVFLLSFAMGAAPRELGDQYQRQWPQWRGPLANGVAPLADPPITWDEKTHIKWKVQIPGDSTATPIVWGNKVFLVSAIKTDRMGEAEPETRGEPAEEATHPKGARPRGFAKPRPTHFYQFVVQCVDRQTGQKQWQHLATEAVPHEGHHPDGSFAPASPATDGKRLYVSFGSRGVYCYDFEGRQQWSRDLGRMTIFNTFGEGCSPVVHGDSVIMNWDHQNGSFIACLDAASGETRWKVDRDENSTWATPLILDYNGRTQVIVHGSKRVRSYDLQTGELLWACGGQGPSAIPSPVSDGRLVYLMTGFITNTLMAIPLDSQGDITETKEKLAWKRNTGTPYVPSPLLYGNWLYFTAGNKGILSCLNAQTGEPVIDKQRLQGVENIYASPVAAADRVYITGRDGTTLVIKHAQFDVAKDSAPGKAQAIILATNRLDDRFDASPALVDGELFLRGRENLYCISQQ